MNWKAEKDEPKEISRREETTGSKAVNLTFSDKLRKTNHDGTMQPLR